MKIHAKYHHRTYTLGFFSLCMLIFVTNMYNKIDDNDFFIVSVNQHLNVYEFTQLIKCSFLVSNQFIIYFEVSKLYVFSLKKNNYKQTRKMSDFVVTNSEFGQIEGLKQQSALGCEYLSFLGVPFAKPPVGNLRFKVSK